MKIWVLDPVHKKQQYFFGQPKKSIDKGSTVVQFIEPLPHGARDPDSILTSGVLCVFP